MDMFHRKVLLNAHLVLPASTNPIIYASIATMDSTLPPKLLPNALIALLDTFLRRLIFPLLNALLVFLELILLLQDRLDAVNALLPPGVPSRALKPQHAPPVLQEKSPHLKGSLQKTHALSAPKVNTIMATTLARIVEKVYGVMPRAPSQRIHASLAKQEHGATLKVSPTATTASPALPEDGLIKKAMMDLF